MEDGFQRSEKREGWKDTKTVKNKRRGETYARSADKVEVFPMATGGCLDRRSEGKYVEEALQVCGKYVDNYL